MGGAPAPGLLQNLSQWQHAAFFVPSASDTRSASFTAQLGDQRGVEALLSHPAVKYVEADGVCSVSAKSAPRGGGGGGEKFKLF